MRWVSENILPETVGTIPVFQGGEGASDNLLGRVDDPLERLPLCGCAAGKPPTDAVCEDALYGALYGSQQIKILHKTNKNTFFVNC